MNQVLKKCNACGREYLTEKDFLQGTSRWRVCERGNLWFNCNCHSTNMIVKGKFDWYSPDQFMSSEAKSIFNQIPSLNQLPHIPTTIMELQQLIQNEEATSKQIATVTKKEPLIASRILQVANNLMQSSTRPIESLEHAISYIGTNVLKDIIITASISSFKFQTKHFQTDQFWQECFLTGRIAEKIAKKFSPRLIPDEAYLAGTLCNIGKVVLAICLPAEADKIYQAISNVNVLGTWEEAEKRHDAFQHTILGEIAASFWGLPEYVLDTSVHHHNLSGHPTTEFPSYTDIAGFANQLSHWILLRPNRIDAPFFKAIYQKFGLDVNSTDQLAEELLPLKTAS